MSRWIAPLFVALMLAFSGSWQPAAAQSGCGYPDVNAEGAIVLTGDGKLNTRPFDLDAKPYTVKWSGKAPDRIAPGNLILTLKRVDAPFPSELLVNTIVNRGDPELSGETQVYVRKAGQHYLEVSAPAGWVVTIAPQ